MSKLTYKDKIKNIKKGFTIKNLALNYRINISIIKYIYRLIDKHGYNILKTNKNKSYTKYEKKKP